MNELNVLAFVALVVLNGMLMASGVAEYYSDVKDGFTQAKIALAAVGLAASAIGLGLSMAYWMV